MIDLGAGFEPDDAGTGAAHEGGRGAGLTLTQFAVWSRRNRVRLPHPLDISQVPSDGVPPPADSPELQLLAEVARAPRLSAFAMRSNPGAGTDVWVAVAGAARAVMVTLAGSAADGSADAARITAVADDQLAARVAETLPDLAPLPMRPAEVPESAWDRFTAQAATADSGAAVDALVARMGEAGLPPNLARAVLAAGRTPVPVGILGAQTWAPDAGASRPSFGPRYAAWFQYGTGAVLAERPAPRGSAPPVLHIGSYARQTVFYALVGAIRDAQGPMAVTR